MALAEFDSRVPRFEIKTPETNPHLVRKEPRDKLLLAYKDISWGHEGAHVKKVGREVFERAGVRYQLYDMLWNRAYEDGVVPEDDREKLLLVENNWDYFRIGDPALNAGIVGRFSGQDVLFGIEVRPYNDREPYVSQDLVDEAKRSIGIATGKFDNGYGREYDSYARTYDILDPNSIEEDYNSLRDLITALAFINRLPDQKRP